MTIAIETNRDNVPEYLESEYEATSEMDDAALVAAFNEAIGMTVSRLCRMAAIIRRWEERGSDMPQIDPVMVSNLRKIAYGQINPHLVFHCMGRQDRLRRVTSLPRPDQDRIAAGEPLPVSVIESDGTRTHRLLPVSKMSDDEFRQVVAMDHVRDVAEQISYKGSERRKAVQSEWDIDRKRKGVIVNRRTFIGYQDLVKIVTQLET